MRFIHLHTAITFLTCSISLFSLAQGETDEAAAKRCFNAFVEHEYTNQILAKVYADSCLHYAYLLDDDEMIERAHRFKGWYYQNNSKYTLANKEFYKALAVAKRMQDDQVIADAYGNLGNSYLDVNEYRKSLEYQFLSLNKNQEILDNPPSEERKGWAFTGRTYALHNIAAIYQAIELYGKALEYEHKSLKYEIDGGDQEGVAISYNTLADIHEDIGNLDSAKYYLELAFDIYDNIPDSYGEGATMQLYATLEGTGMTPEEQREMIEESLALRRRMGDYHGEGLTLIEIGELHFNELSNDSLSILVEGIYQLIEAHPDLDVLNESYYRLYSRYSSRIGKYDAAYFALENFLELKAISDAQKLTRDLIAQDIRQEWKLKNEKDSLENQNEITSIQLDLAAKQNYIYLSVIGLIVLVIVLWYILLGSRRRKKNNELLLAKNEEIQEQKSMVEEKNQSITDSMKYAKRLQTAILPTKVQVNEYLPDSFLLFKPKEAVSGDFHWFEAKDDVIYVAVADCTGHGVPGAMVSVVCSNALNRSVNEFGLTEPAAILDKARELVIQTFAKSGDQVNDGMDIALCAIQKNRHELIYAGANNPLWIIKPDGTLVETKGDKQPVGQYAKMTPFTQHRVSLESGDIIYLSSDGFADQFGGEHGKKFKYAPFKRELISIHTQSMQAQKTHLAKLFEKWKGDHEQVDDVCIIGIRIY